MPKGDKSKPDEITLSFPKQDLDTLAWSADYGFRLLSAPSDTYRRSIDQLSYRQAAGYASLINKFERKSVPNLLREDEDDREPALRASRTDNTRFGPAIRTNDERRTDATGRDAEIGDEFSLSYTSTPISEYPQTDNYAEGCEDSTGEGESMAAKRAAARNSAREAKEWDRYVVGSTSCQSRDA